MGRSNPNEATFAVALKDETSGPARDAAAALEQLQSKIDSDTRALRDMQRAMRALKGATVVNVDAVRELKDRIAAQKASIAQAQSSYISLGGTFGNTRKAAQAVSGGFGELTAMAQGMPGPLGAVVGRLGALRGLVVGGGIAGAILAIVAASAALVGVTVGLTAALFRYGVAQSDARRSELLRIEGLNTLHHWMGRVRASAGEMQAAIDRAADSTNLGRGELDRYARQLARTGLAGDSLASALEAMSIAQMVQGERGAALFRAQVANARLTGRSVEDVAEAYRRRLGPIARRQMLSLDNQSDRLRRNLGRMFGGLRIEGFLSAIAEVADLFSQTTASGRALKAVVETLLQPLVDDFEAVGPIARRVFQGMVIGALLVSIGLVRVRRAMREAFGDSTLLENINAQRVAIYAGLAIFSAFAGAVTAAAVVMAALGAALAVVVASAAAMVAPFVAAAAAVYGLGYAIGTAIERIVETDWRGLGRELASGLAGGITEGVTTVVGAVRGLGDQARRALADVLQIRSPSRVFARLGVEISRGVATGVDEGAPRVESSVSDMVPVPEGGSVRSSTSVSIGDVHIHAGGGGDGRGMAADFMEELVRLLEGAGIEVGAPA